MQTHLTFRNNLRNVKRRVLHTRGSAMCYITRDIARVLFYVNYLRWIRGYRAVSFVFRARLNEKQK